MVQAEHSVGFVCLCVPTITSEHNDLQYLAREIHLDDRVKPEDKVLGQSLQSQDEKCSFLTTNQSID